MRRGGRAACGWPGFLLGSVPDDGAEAPRPGPRSGGPWRPGGPASGAGRGGCYAGFQSPTGTLAARSAPGPPPWGGRSRTHPEVRAMTLWHFYFCLFRAELYFGNMSLMYFAMPSTVWAVRSSNFFLVVSTLKSTIFGAVLDNPIMGYQVGYEKEPYQPNQTRSLD